MSYTNEQRQSNLDNAYRTKDYGKLSQYNSSLGVPVNPGPFPVSMSKIPIFSGPDYVNPNYNSLVSSVSCSNSYPTVTDGYMVDNHDCVQYKNVSRPCAKNNLNPNPYGPIKPQFYYSEGYMENPSLRSLASPYQHDSSCKCAP